MTLSILIATYNRKELLKTNLKNIFYQLDKSHSNQVEIIVSVNPSGDGTEDYLINLPTRNNFRFHINEFNIGGINNLLNLIRMAKGKYIWLVGDDDQLASGLIERVLSVVNKNPDIGWIYINSLGLTKTANGKVVIKNINSRLDGGYWKDGYEILNKLWRKLPGNILFQTSNIYLREPTLKVLDSVSEGNSCRWVFYIFNSIYGRGAYIINDLSILQGPERSWSDNFFQITCYHYQQMILDIGKLPMYSKDISIDMLRYYLLHEGLVYWIYLFRWMTKDITAAKNAYNLYFNAFPFLTILMTIGLPLEILFVGIRHYIIRAFIRNKAIFFEKQNPKTIREEWLNYLE